MGTCPRTARAAFPTANGNAAPTTALPDATMYRSFLRAAPLSPCLPMAAGRKPANGAGTSPFPCTPKPIATERVSCWATRSAVGTARARDHPHPSRGHIPTGRPGTCLPLALRCPMIQGSLSLSPLSLSLSLARARRLLHGLTRVSGTDRLCPPPMHREPLSRLGASSDASDTPRKARNIRAGYGSGGTGAWSHQPCPHPCPPLAMLGTTPVPVQSQTLVSSSMPALAG